MTAPMDRGDLIVERSDIWSPAALAPIGALNPELTGIYPEESATHFRLDPDEWPTAGAPS